MSNTALKTTTNRIAMFQWIMRTQKAISGNGGIDKKQSSQCQCPRQRGAPSLLRGRSKRRAGILQAANNGFSEFCRGVRTRRGGSRRKARKEDRPTATGRLRDFLTFYVILVPGSPFRLLR